VGTRKRIKRGSKQDSHALEDNPFSIFKEGPGKPSPRDAYLFHQRESLIWPIETYWADVGWALACARTPEDIRTAFGLIAQNTNTNSLAPIFRDGSAPSTVESIRQVRKQVGEAVENERSQDDLYQTALHSYQDAERSAFKLSEEHKKQLQNELVRRRKNIREIRIQISIRKGQIRKLNLQKQNETEPSIDAAKPGLAALEDALRTLQHEREADERVCEALMKQINLITPEHEMLTAKRAAHRKVLLDTAEQRLNEARRVTRELVSKLEDQEAFFFRTQVLAFIKQRRYAVTPRSLANAIAGLPYMTARHSAERCAGLKSEIAELRNYTTLIFVTSAWNRRGQRGNLRPVEWYEREIKKLPKFRIIAKRRIPNGFRAYLCEGWYYLKRAITETRRLKLDPRAMPYAITASFLKSVSGTQNPVETAQAEAAQIT
jgi:hypothetical protein